MKVYRVTVHRTQEVFFEVHANSRTEATEKAKRGEWHDVYGHGEIIRETVSSVSPGTPRLQDEDLDV